ncbi:hypothetical protein IQ16_01772 [Bradyrhizobium huanghuaihaiense]|uniref:Uncharacterized protein n=1 Tax=Bradyrhizobium huanghuaihaiense TaxID=990078 RepID=A0A562RYE2_9BRAD|nr:hypothetical protein [Bradyrhizobium huanghuaihaiense]TWI73634.1 hypothetical protein IQ16_01772 [Bradyrhizobium huanghuaihaiense]
MRSLTSFLPDLVPIFGISEQAIYERQRALVRIGMLAAPKGRGRGSGVEATPGTVARLLVAVLATDNLSDTDERVHKLALAPFTATDKRASKSGGAKWDRCPWTGAQTFVDALAFLLSPEAPILPAPKPGAHTSVRVYRGSLGASIGFVWSRRPGKGRSEFGQPDYAANNRIKVEAQLPFEALRAIHQRLNFGERDEHASQP